MYDPSNNKSILIKVEEKPDVTYADVGGCAAQIAKLREVVETPLLHPERFVNLGIEPPKAGLLTQPKNPKPFFMSFG